MKNGDFVDEDEGDDRDDLPMWYDNENDDIPLWSSWTMTMRSSTEMESLNLNFNNDMKDTEIENDVEKENGGSNTGCT